MIALLAATFLSMGQGKSAIETYERNYWAGRHIPAVTNVSNCRRRNRSRIACIAYTRIVERPGKVTHLTLTDTVTFTQGVLKIEPGKSGLFDTEEQLR